MSEQTEAAARDIERAAERVLGIVQGSVSETIYLTAEKREHIYSIIRTAILREAGACAGHKRNELEGSDSLYIAPDGLVYHRCSNRTAILGSQAALVAQLTEALESVCGVLETVLEVQHAEYHGGDDDWKTCTGSAVCEKGLELLLRAHMILKSAADAQKSADARREERG